MKTIVIGSGGREHAIAWALASSPDVTEVVCIPGNGGTAVEHKCRNLSIPVSETLKVVKACASELSGAPEGSLVVIGPEDPLAAGMADSLAAAGVAAVGPRLKAARLEASKDAAKDFMRTYGVACAASETFTNPEEAVTWLENGSGPIVVKADGLAAGKGVVVAPDRETAVKAVRDFMVDGSLGAAGRKVVLEEYLEGEEISILAAVSVTPESAREGKATILPFLPARDHKRLLDGAKGPNTGGMGAVAPAPGVSEETLRRFRSDILEPTLRGFIAEGYDYRGFVFFGLMITPSGPKLLEYNVRLGDPETQAVLPLMESDFFSLCRSIADGTLGSFPLSWKEGVCCAPVAVSRGYPGSYEKGKGVSINRSALEAQDARVFVAGAIRNQRKSLDDGILPEPPESSLVTTGGRVLCVSAVGATLEEARERAYGALSGVTFEGMLYRRDIGLPGAAVSAGF